MIITGVGCVYNVTLHTIVASQLQYIVMYFTILNKDNKETDILSEIVMCRFSYIFLIGRFIEENKSIKTF